AVSLDRTNHHPKPHITQITTAKLLVLSRHATASTVPRFQGQGRPPGQTIQEGRTMTKAAVSFAGNLTDDPEVRYTEGGIARAMFRGAVSGRREQERAVF